MPISKLNQLDENCKESDGMTVNAKKSIAISGYNLLNIPCLPSAPPMSESDLKGLNLSTQQINGSYIGNEQNISNLVKPNIPIGEQYPDENVSRLVVEKIWRIVCLNKLYAFFTQQRLQELTNRACKHDYKILMNQWNINSIETVTDLSVLGLYNIIILGDDSSSMTYNESSEDNLTRWALLRIIVRTISFWGTLMDEDGIDVQFLNSTKCGECIKDHKNVEKLFNKVSPDGSTPIGETINKIIQKNIAPLMKKNKLNRPIIIIIVTDGSPDSKDAVLQSIINCKQLCSQTKYGEHAVVFSFSQVGNDQSATEWLDSLDSHSTSDPNTSIGNIVDCTSSFNIEQQQCANLTPAEWSIKIMIGPIDPAYDAKDKH